VRFKNDRKFDDKLFPADRSSLYSSKHHGKDKKLIKFYKAYSNMIDNWKRPNITSDYLKNIVPYEVGHQGVLNDGWFLGAISSLAENSEYIKKIFSTDKSLIKKGAYELNFYVRGKKQQVLIDDRFAVEGYGKYINA